MAGKLSEISLSKHEKLFTSLRSTPKAHRNQHIQSVTGFERGKEGKSSSPHQKFKHFNTELELHILQWNDLEFLALGYHGKKKNVKRKILTKDKNDKKENVESFPRACDGIVWWDCVKPQSITIGSNERGKVIQELLSVSRLDSHPVCVSCYVILLYISLFSTLCFNKKEKKRRLAWNSF